MPAKNNLKMRFASPPISSQFKISLRLVLGQSWISLSIVQTSLDLAQAV